MMRMIPVYGWYLYTDGAGVCNPGIGRCGSALSNHQILVDDPLYKLLSADDPKASLEGVSLITVFPGRVGLVFGGHLFSPSGDVDP